MKRTVSLQKQHVLPRTGYFPFFFLLFLFSLILGPYAFAESVRSVSPEGIIETDKGRRYVLAGIDIIPEGYPILLTLLAGQNISTQKEPALDALESDLRNAYIYVRVRETMLPAEIQFEFSENRVMVNELLISFGAARVIYADFKRKMRFLELEDLAKQRGEGVWSYEQVELLQEGAA